jgi:hypothetical protein
MARHSDLRVGSQRFAEQRFRFSAIAWGGAIDQHHCEEAPYLCLFEAVRKGLCLLLRALKVILSGFPLTRGSRGDTRDGLRETGDRPKRYCSSLDQFANKWVKLSSPQSFAQDDKALSHKREHQPRTSVLCWP